MIDIVQIADCADMIINGYAFTRENENIKVLNLNNPVKSVFMNHEGEVLFKSRGYLMKEISLKYKNLLRKIIKKCI